MENEKVGKEERMKAAAEIILTDEEIAENMATWKPYLAYVDNLISKALIQAASTRYRGLANIIKVHIIFC